VKLYEKVKTLSPDKEKALAYVQSFSYADWAAQLTDLLGSAADSMIALEAKEKKYDPDLHAKRLAVILQNWDAILKIIDEELPSAADTEALLDTIGAPKTLSQIGTPDEMLPVIFKATKDIRDKYVLSRLCWDLGILEQIL
jgi:glycerol-1-phosphate dehydrogenase [NAD(P)+]